MTALTTYDGLGLAAKTHGPELASSSERVEMPAPVTGHMLPLGRVDLVPRSWSGCCAGSSETRLGCARCKHQRVKAF